MTPTTLRPPQQRRRLPAPASHSCTASEQAGYASYLQLLNAEQAYQHALLRHVQAQANRYADTAALFQALGGGWWNLPRSELDPR